MNSFKNYLVQTGLDLLFPRRCPICDEPVRPFGALICEECRGVPAPVMAPVCRKCGKEIRPWQDYCSDCARYMHPYERGCAVYRYHSVSASLYRFKYKGRAEYAEYYGRCMAAVARERLLTPDLHNASARNAPDSSASRYDRREFMRGGRSDFDVIVPVPVSAERLRRRGYNQAGLLAEVLGRELGIPVIPDALRRRQNTSVMRGLDAAARRLNLEKAFIGIRNDVESRKVILVDDIYTTGATIDACANALLRAGAESVCFVVLAIGDDPRTGSGT